MKLTIVTQSTQDADAVEKVLLGQPPSPEAPEAVQAAYKKESKERRMSLGFERPVENNGGFEKDHAPAKGPGRSIVVNVQDGEELLLPVTSHRLLLKVG